MTQQGCDDDDRRPCLGSTAGIRLAKQLQRELQTPRIRPGFGNGAERAFGIGEIQASWLRELRRVRSVERLGPELALDLIRDRAIAPRSIRVEPKLIARASSASEEGHL